MFSLILPPARRYSILIGFWLALSLFTGVAGGAVLSLLVSPALVTLGLIAVPFLALPGLLWPPVAIPAYAVWNKLAREFARYARTSLMGICFYVIVVAVGRSGASLRLSRPDSGQSLWVRRQDSTGARNGFERVIATDESSKNWIRNFFRWSARSRNLWACGVLPFLILLSALDPEQDTTVPKEIYTLF
jgi:hypothetical protein